MHYVTQSDMIERETSLGRLCGLMIVSVFGFHIQVTVLE